MGFAASRLGTALLVWLPGGALYFAVILYSAAVMVNFLGCGWFFVARAEHFEGTWLSRVGARPHFIDYHIRPQSMLRAMKAAGCLCSVRKAVARFASKYGHSVCGNSASPECATAGSSRMLPGKPYSSRIC